MTFKTKMALLIAVVLWASAYVGIRAGLQGYSPAGLALLRYLIASACMGVIYYRMPNRNTMHFKDICGLLALGAVGIGLYNITLNSGEVTVSSGVSSFIIAQSPIITAFIAVIFLGEKMDVWRILGFIISILGVVLITLGEVNGFKWTVGLSYIVAATLAASTYTILQKPFLKKYHAIEATTYVIWGGTLFLGFYAPQLHQDLLHASLSTTLTVVYLGVFPATIGYIAWAYALSEIPASQAVSFLYFTPFVAVLLGWLWLGEVPVLITLVGGLLAIVGVWLVNHSYRRLHLTSARSAA